MTTCPAHLAGDGPACTLDAGHPHGHVYHSGTGSWTDDGHEAGGHG